MRAEVRSELKLIKTEWIMKFELMAARNARKNERISQLIVNLSDRQASMRWMTGKPN